MTQPDGERLASLEEWRRGMDPQLVKLVERVDEIHAIMLQAKGARYVIVAGAGIAGLISGWAAKFLPLLWK